MSRYRFVRILLVVTALALAPSAGRAQVAAPSLNVFTPCTWGSADCNLSLPNVVSSFNNLRDHGDVLGFQLGSFPDDLCFGLGCNHWQGIQRLPGGSGQYLAVSRSGSTMLSVVKMESRNPAGLRFRSNRLSPGLFLHQTAPPALDRIVTQLANDPGFSHAGGMQALGNVLAVPLESGTSKVVFYDLTSPSAPVRLYEVDHPESNEAGTASLARLGDGRFLLIIGRSEANILDFYVSSGTVLTATGFTRFYTWSEGELLSTLSGDFEFGDYQNLSLVGQSDGALYLVGTHNNSDIAGQDFADLFRLQNGAGNQVLITKVAKKHLYCSYPSPGSNGDNSTHCNLDAAGGVYVDPNRNLLLYATEHASNGPANSVKFMEFRSIFPNPTCSLDINQAFVELYDDSNWSDRGLMIDYPDRSLENYANYDQAEGFEDKASAVRYCIPAGWRYRLFKDKNFSGGVFDLTGTGSINLGSAGFGDKTSSSQWLNF